MPRSGSGRKIPAILMAPAHIPVFLSQKPSTEDGIILPAILFVAWIVDVSIFGRCVRLTCHTTVLRAHLGAGPEDRAPSLAAARRRAPLAVPGAGRYTLRCTARRALHTATAGVAITATATCYTVTATAILDRGVQSPYLHSGTGTPRSGQTKNHWSTSVNLALVELCTVRQALEEGDCAVLTKAWAELCDSRRAPLVCI